MDHVRDSCSHDHKPCFAQLALMDAAKASVSITYDNSLEKSNTN
jgi:hypothetical protein